MRETRHGVAFEAPKPLTRCRRATNSKMPTVRRSRPTHTPCATEVGRCVQCVEVAAGEVGCSNKTAERNEQNVAQVHNEHVGRPRLEGGRCVTLQTVPRDQYANLVRCLWMEMVSEARAGLACLSFRDHAHAVEA